MVQAIIAEGVRAVSTVENAGRLVPLAIIAGLAATIPLAARAGRKIARLKNARRKEEEEKP